MDLKLKGKAALITGGSIGIGLAVAEALAAEGVELLICARNEERVRREAERIARQFNVRCIGVAADVALATGTDTVAAAAAAGFGGLDILINNAGTGNV